MRSAHIHAADRQVDSSESRRHCAAFLLEAAGSS